MSDDAEGPVNSGKPEDQQGPTPPADSPYGAPQAPPPQGSTPGQSAYGQAPGPGDGQPPYGQPQYGQPPQYDQSPYGQPQYGQPQGQGQGQGPYGLSSADERLWMGAAHWSALVATFVGFTFLGPLVVLLAKGNQSPRIRQQAVESLNFQLSILIYTVVSAVLVLVLVGILLLIAVAIFWLTFTIIAAVKASNGEDYRYPLTIRMVS